MRLWLAVIGVFLVLGASIAVRSQDPPAAAQPQDQYFAGIVTLLSDTSITITRTVLGKPTVRNFMITPDTVMQGGKPKLKSRVTVKWVTREEGDLAVKIIVRGSNTPPPPKKP